MKIYVIAILGVCAFSCAKEKYSVKHVVKQTSPSELRNIKVFNAQDPICQMKTAEFLKDTAIYKGRVYGFCSDYCKKEFKKNPKNYATSEK
ncbi:YHS domain-containing protein [Elizabethkingia argentiflava]|uniref:YHS domain-containing protein n=1 Tax=Elizabethkingia argenteiflava TaxID=2681556 RepID=A0A845PXX2_9FLAO|nr:YHS domain-containing protein [Elizabethkingia argenteiflava]NAW52103.1 YHS domain-containing protein [Elizabethkingia argenteiflava]